MDTRNLTFMFYGVPAAWLVLGSICLAVSRERKITEQREVFWATWSTDKTFGEPHHAARVSLE